VPRRGRERPHRRGSLESGILCAASLGAGPGSAGTGGEGSSAGSTIAPGALPGTAHVRGRKDRPAAPLPRAGRSWSRPQGCRRRGFPDSRLPPPVRPLPAPGEAPRLHTPKAERCGNRAPDPLGVRDDPRGGHPDPPNGGPGTATSPASRHRVTGGWSRSLLILILPPSRVSRDGAMEQAPVSSYCRCPVRLGAPDAGRFAGRRGRWRIGSFRGGDHILRPTGNRYRPDLLGLREIGLRMLPGRCVGQGCQFRLARRVVADRERADDEPLATTDAARRGRMRSLR